MNKHRDEMINYNKNRENDEKLRLSSLFEAQKANASLFKTHRSFLIQGDGKYHYSANL